MRRYVLSKIKLVNGPIGPVYRHRLQQVQEERRLNFEYLGGNIKTGPDGKPTEKALLCLIAGNNHAALRDDPELLLLPMISHDIKVSSIHTATKLRAKAAIVAMGHDVLETEVAWDNADGFRDVVEHYGRKNNPAFDADDFDLFDS